MKRRHGCTHHPASPYPGTVVGPLVLTLLLLGVTAQVCLATQPLVLRQDDNRILQFQNMKRVWVQDPEIMDVVVTSYNELLVYSKAVGRTKLIVWDQRGRHEYAVEIKTVPPVERVVSQLTSILGRGLRYTIVDDRTVLVEGEVPSQAEKDRVTRVVAARSNGVVVHDLTHLPGAHQTPAQEYRDRFERLFPEGLRYNIVDESTLVIEGDVVTAAEKTRMDKILAAASGVNVVDLVRSLESRLSANQQRIASIRDAVGPELEYLELEDEILVIGGQVDTQSQRERIDKIITAAAGDLTIINVVGVKTDTRAPSARVAEMLPPVLGDRYNLTPLGQDGLVVEGMALSGAEEERVRQVLSLVSDQVRVVNLVTTGPRTPGETAVAMLSEALGSSYQVRLVTDDVVVVDGLAETTAEKSRVDTAVNAAPEGARVVNLVSVRAPDAEGWQATRYARALEPVLGEDLTYRVLDETTLLVEGYVATSGERARADRILSALEGPMKFLNLLALQPGPEALAHSPASDKAEVLTQVLDARYRAVVVDENTVAVYGVAPGQAEKERVEQVIQQLAGDVTVVSLVDPEDGVGTRSPSDRALAKLRPLVPGNLQLVAVDHQTALVEGIVPTSIDADRVEKICEVVAQSTNADVLCLVLSEMHAKTPAARRIEGLRRILGDQYNYIVWDEDTVLVEGQVETEEERERLRTIIQAANQDWKVGDLVTVGSPGERAMASEEVILDAVEHLSRMLGENYRVWRLKADKVVVDGLAADDAAFGRVEQIVGAFDELDILNFVTTAPEPVLSPNARAESLRAILGENFQVRVLQGRAIVVEANVPTKAEAERARAIMAALGTEFPIVDLVQVVDPAKRQVLARVKVLDINRGYMQRLGVNWGALQLPDQTSFKDQPFLMAVDGGIGTAGRIAANIDLLKQNDWARVLAEPNLVVNEGEEASIVVGGEVPIPVPQTGEGVGTITIEYKEYGVVLRMKPTIHPDGKSLTLALEPEVSSIDPSTQVSIGGIAVPAFRTRKTQTVVDIPDGATLVLGGLIQHDQSKVVRSIPVLGSLPIIGSLFRSTEWRQGLTELVILVTPEILKTTEP